MLSWICPDCGCDCAPSDNECPDCADLVQAGMLALARAVQTHRDTAPPPPEIPMHDRLPGGLQPVAPRQAPQPPPRSPELELQSSSRVAPLIPLSSGGLAETQIPEPPVPEIRTAELPAVAVPAPAPLPVKKDGHPARRSKVPGWLLSLIVATILSLGGAAIVRNMAQAGRADAPAPASQAASAPQVAFASYVEVTGLRVMVDLKRTSQLRYIIVNHSSTLLSNLALRVSVHSGSASSKPLFTISALVTGLAPYESREMVTEIDDLATKEIPEWDRLKPVVHVVTP